LDCQILYHGGDFRATDRGAYTRLAAACLGK